MRLAPSTIIAGIALRIALGETPALAADADTERARSLFDEAGELERHGQWGMAQERLRAALHLRETPQLYYALGWALENDDKLLEARAEYETAIRSGRDRVGAEEATRLAIARLAELDHKTPIIKVHTGGARSIVRVTVDGRDIKREDDLASTPVNPGSHVIRVERVIGGPSEQMVYVARGSIRTIDIGPLPVATTTAPSSPAARGNDVLPWLLLSGGVAFVAGGGALLLSARSDNEASESMRERWCTATACTGAMPTRRETAQAAAYRESSTNASDTGNTKETFGLVMLGSGIVAAAVGTVLLLRGDDPSAKTGRSRAPRTAASPLPGGGIATTTLSF